MKRIGDIETEKYSLTIYECECGFHIGLDNSYMDQIDDICIECPACERHINTEEIDELNEDEIFSIDGC